MPTVPIASLLDYVGFSSVDANALRALYDKLHPEIPRIVRVFYASVKKDPVAHAVLDNDAQIDRLKLSLQRWLERVLSGPWDDDYAKRRARIGRIHVKVGLPQRFMFTAMSVIRGELYAAVARLYSDKGPDKRDALAGQLALARILDVDLAIMLETYREDSMTTLRRLEEVERRLIAKELSVSEERYRAVLETAEVIAIAIDRQGVVRLFNRHAETVSGCSRTEALSLEEVATLWHPSDRNLFETSLEQVREGMTVPPFEGRLVTRDSQTRTVRWHVTGLPPKSDAEVCFIGVDLTVERGLAKRTRRSEELAILGTLAAGLAHEIRNPLNAAQLQLTVAERRISRSDPRKALEPISRVHDELGRLTKLVQDFLAYARPAPINLRAIDLQALSLSVIEFLAPVANEKGVLLRLVDQDMITIRCDEKQCRQVLLNLIKNAIEATPQDNGQITVEVRREGPSAFVRIVDNGSGFPADIDVFEPFATSKEGGTGLGLPIVKRIIEQHDGTVTIHSRNGLTVVEIEIPVAGPQINRPTIKTLELTTNPN